MARADNDDRMMPRRAGRTMRRAVVAALLCAMPGASIWQCRAAADVKFPERPVRIIVPYGTGSAVDVVLRLVGDKLGERLGQRFVVENVPGVGGFAAARATLQAPADGYTIALFTNGTAISVPLFKKLPFDPLKDFMPISSVGFYDGVFVSNAASEYRTMGDFLKGAHEKPGTLNIGTVNVGSTQYLSAELLKSMSGANFVVIPFRSSSETIVALLRNDIQMVVDFPLALHAGLADHKLRPVAATGPVSAHALGGIPTVAQAGVPGYEVTSWNALYAPAGTPREYIDVLNAALHEVVLDTEVKRRAGEFGIEARAGSPAEADAIMRGDIAKWDKVITEARIPKQ
jgi:tripartite-type tricarboxylate transporter receptor subunit TctC